MNVLEKFSVGQPVVHRYLGNMLILKIHPDQGFADIAEVTFKNIEIYVSVRDLEVVKD